MNECLFCKIIKNEIPSETVFESDVIRIFKDINPKAPVHLLIVPKKHIESIQTLTANDGDVLLNMVFGAKMIAEKQKLSGYKLVFNVGKQGGQIIDHIHLHLLGGWQSPKPLDI